MTAEAPADAIETLMPKFRECLDSERLSGGYRSDLPSGLSALGGKRFIMDT
jgi:hypothetical protein